MAYRKSIMSLSHAKNSLFALGPEAVGLHIVTASQMSNMNVPCSFLQSSDHARQSLLVSDQYTYKDNDGYTSRRSSFLREGWSNSGSADYHDDNDVLLIPGGKNNRHIGQAM
jgi:putative intracellular protease/amidase